MVDNEKNTSEITKYVISSGDKLWNQEKYAKNAVCRQYAGFIIKLPRWNGVPPPF